MQAAICQVARARVLRNSGPITGIAKGMIAFLTPAKDDLDADWDALARWLQSICGPRDEILIVPQHGQLTCRPLPNTEVKSREFDDTLRKRLSQLAQSFHGKIHVVRDDDGQQPLIEADIVDSRFAMLQTGDNDDPPAH